METGLLLEDLTAAACPWNREALCDTIKI